MEIGEIERLYDQKVLLERDAERFISQMKSLDLDVFGSKPCQEYHDGVNGINDQIGALRELHKMIKDYIKEI
jgi:hypothetical protein